MKRPPVSLVGLLTKLHGHSQDVAASPGSAALGRFAVTVIGARESRSLADFADAVDQALEQLDQELAQD